MSSNSNPDPNPNPNPNPNPFPNWLHLPEDIWSLIFSKQYTIHLIRNVQKVCILFRKICKQPSLYKVVDMTLPYDLRVRNSKFNTDIMTLHIVDRSCGCLIDLYLERLWGDDNFMYIILRSKNLKHLRLGSFVNISDEALLDAVKVLPELEEVELGFPYSAETIEAIGVACSSLKSFSMNDDSYHSRSDNAKALAIAKSMPNLRKLQLIGDLLNSEGLTAILDGCPRLESLNLRGCFYIVLSEDLAKRCGNIKHLRLPIESIADYSDED